MRRLLAVSCVAVTLAVSSASVRAAPYQFEFLAERPRSTSSWYSNVYKLPALNDYGTVAFVAPRVWPITGTLPDETLYTGTPGNLRAVDAPGIRVTGGVSINNPGRIAFIGFPSEGAGSYGVYSVAPGGPVTTIMPSAMFGNRHETAISDSGMVVTTMDRSPGLPSWVPVSAMMGDGTSAAQTIFTTHAPWELARLQGSAVYRPRMNAAGDWMVHESGAAQMSYSGLHTKQGSMYASSGDWWTSIASGDIADNGVVLFQGKNHGESTSKFYTSRPGEIQVVVPGSDGLSGTLAINDDGSIALLNGGGGDETQGTQLRLLRNGALETVLAQGDPLLGSTVSTIGFDPKGFNNAGQFALLVGLADGRDVYVLASPVPEPAGVAMIGAICGVAALSRRRR